MIIVVIAMMLFIIGLIFILIGTSTNVDGAYIIMTGYRFICLSFLIYSIYNFKNGMYIIASINGVTFIMYAILEYNSRQTFNKLFNEEYGDNNH